MRISGENQWFLLLNLHVIFLEGIRKRWLEFSKWDKKEILTLKRKWNNEKNLEQVLFWQVLSNDLQLNF